MSDISFPINTSLNDYQSNHAGRMYKHYAHAREKHPYFCDWIGPAPGHKENIVNVANQLAFARARIKDAIERSELSWIDLLNCEVWEVHDAYTCGDTTSAIKELYDCIAVLLRTIDVLEGRQKLGKPETEGVK